MTEFVCTFCGKCCMGMGRYVKITGIMGEGRYAARHEISKEVFYATVDKKFRGKFNPLNRNTPPEWCPFLMDKDDDGNYLCSIYDSAPSFCKNFKCCSCRIFKSDGTPTGMVKGKSTLVTDDPELEKLWNEVLESVTDMDLEEEREKIVGILKESGYKADYYD